MSHYCTVCSYPERNGVTLLKKGGVQINQRVNMGDAGVDGHGWLWLGAAPGNSTWLICPRVQHTEEKGVD